MSKPSESKLRELYVEKGVSGTRIAEEYNVTSTTIYGWMDDYGIERRDPHNGGKLDVECGVCSATVKRWPRDLKRHDVFFCSESCRREYNSESNSGEGNPNYRGGKETIECHLCGQEAEKLPRLIEQDDRHFCSQSCNAKWYAEERGKWTGEDNPMYGRRFAGHDLYYGPNWEEQRQKTLNRDGHECVVCGTHENLCIHHKRAIHTFDRTEDGWWNRANDLSNLTTLCRSCHQKVHSNDGNTELGMF